MSVKLEYSKATDVCSYSRLESKAGYFKPRPFLFCPPSTVHVGTYSGSAQVSARRLFKRKNKPESRFSSQVRVAVMWCFVIKAYFKISQVEKMKRR